MSEKFEHFSHAASVFPVYDIERSIKYYTEKLGFTLQFEWNDPTDYAIVTRGDVSVHLSKCDKPVEHFSDHTSLYVFVRNIRDLYDTYKKNGVNCITEIGRRDYQMIDFDIKDPDGHILSFGQGIEM